MNKNTKQYDLEERTFEFARCVREFVKKLPRTIVSIRKYKGQASLIELDRTFDPLHGPHRFFLNKCPDYLTNKKKYSIFMV